MSNPNVVRSTALRAGGACVRCRKGKTKCVYENGRAPCKNCAKGMHECYLPSESMAHHHGQSPARHQATHRPPRESLPGSGPGSSEARQPVVGANNNARHAQATADKLTPELIAECERVVTKTFPACVAFHKPSFVQQIKAAALEPVLIYGLLTCAARSSPALIRRYGGPTPAAEYFAGKTIGLVNGNIDHPGLADIQAMCLLIIHEWGSRNAVRAYVYLGQAVRMMHMFRILDSHHPTGDNEPHQAPTESDLFLKEESLRRTIWLIYILDCFLTSSPGRFPALSRNDLTSVALPCTDINFAFGNTVYGKTIAQHLDPAYRQDPNLGEVGEFGHIVLASMIWRDTIDLLQTSSPNDFHEDAFVAIVSRIESLRASLPMQFRDKPGQVNLHMTMGSGYTFAVLHCLLHCSSVFAQRRRLLQDITSPNVDMDTFRQTARCHDIVDRLFTSCHAINGLLLAIEAGAEKDHNPCFPIFMLFSSFTASATVAYMSLKGLTPANALETASQVVQDGLRLMSEGADSWPLMTSWLRHLAVMQRVIANATDGRPQDHRVKEENSSNGDAGGAEPMDYDHAAQPGENEHRATSEAAHSENEASVQLPRRPGFSAINNGSATTSNPGTQSPPAAPPAPMQAHEPASSTKGHSPSGTPGPTGNNGHVVASQDMTGPELCAAFERQLLEMDDLAAFMGGGV